MSDPTIVTSVSTYAAKGFETDGPGYDKFRPSYTSDTVRLVASEIKSFQGFATNTERDNAISYNVVELGAGTGKFTELLVQELPSSMKYLAVEPSRDFYRVLVSKKLNIQTALGEAAAIPAAEASVENIVCAEAFHWFADDLHLKEFRRVLVPGGNLIIVFNFRDYSVGWMKEFYKQRLRLHQRIGDSVKHIVFSMEWRQDISASPLFKVEWERSLAGFPLRGSVEDLLHHTKTMQCYKNLPENEVREAMEELRQVLVNWPGLDLNNIVYPLISKVHLYKAV